MAQSSSQLVDAEFGLVLIRRYPGSSSVRLRVDHSGKVRISMPPRTPLLFARQLLNQSRVHIRGSISKLRSSQQDLVSGDLIGKTHKLVIEPGADLSSRLVGTRLHVTLPGHVDVTAPSAQAFIKQAALKALRAQARAYLSRRLDALSKKHGFNYHRVRFSAAGTRWGSCSSDGTISLNIWLMQLPFELIDYVLVHELCHTVHMNHSPSFWASVGSIVPNYKPLRRELKNQHPFM